MSEETGGRTPLEEALETLRANPEIITKIADAMGMSAPSGAAEETEPKSDGQGGNTLDALPTLLSALGEGSGRLNLGALMGDPNKKALLRALCPYLNPARRESAEAILRIWSLGDVLKGK